MAATTQHLLGQLADGRFPLRKLLGVSQNSAVFLTYTRPEHPSDPAPDAAIKLIPEDASTSDTQLARWRAAAALSYPGLLRILHSGRCVIDGASCLYVVTELADEDLGQLLPTRALTADETRGMLAAVLPTLDFLHEKGLLHGGLKPSNIHAIGDSVKLSADRILPAGESASTWPLAAPFAAPESVLFPASDVWSLGVSLCETLSRTLPTTDGSRRFVLPELPAPFAEIVRSALVEDATLRISLEQVRSLLDPSFVAKPKPGPTAKAVQTPANPERRRAAKAGSTPEPASPYVRPPEAPDSPESLVSVAETATTPVAPASRAPLPQIDPLAVPLSPVSPKSAPQPSRAPIPVKSLPQVSATIGSARRVISPNPAPRSNKLFLVGAAAAILFAILAVPRYLSRHSAAPNPSAPVAQNSAKSRDASSAPENSSRANPSASAKPGSTAPVPASAPPPSVVKSSRVDLSSPDRGPSSSGSPAASDKTTPAAASASRNETGPVNVSPGQLVPQPPSTKPAPSAANPLAPTVLRKVLPEVSEKARGTISGTVRINVRVQLNPDGTVSSAELANPASSEFFANLALKAARQWQFAQPASTSAAASSDSAAVSSMPSSTVIRFDFTQTATSAALP
jgi:TonB family protein